MYLGLSTKLLLKFTSVFPGILNLRGSFFESFVYATASISPFESYCRLKGRRWAAKTSLKVSGSFNTFMTKAPIKLKQWSGFYMIETSAMKELCMYDLLVETRCYRVKSQRPFVLFDFFPRFWLIEFTSRHRVVKRREQEEKTWIIDTRFILTLQGTSL